jgi:L-ribulose-5-phosphate 3-epimerase
MLGRFFPGNWRPPLDEICFAARNGFAAVQIRSDRPGNLEEVLGADPAAVGRVFEDAGIECVVEMLLRFSEPVTVAGALRANLPALKALTARRVHVHPVPGAAHIDAHALELELEAQFVEGCELAESEGLILGVEHNARDHPLLIEPETCARLLEAVPALSFVWDLNHTEAEHVEAFRALTPRLSLMHVSDTPLPETNHHLPIGRGNVDFSVLRGIDVPLILEVGGLPASGGPGFDVDEVLRESRDRLLALDWEPSSADTSLSD